MAHVGITLEGTSVAAEEAKRAVSAGASAGLIYPSHGWLRFGYQKGAPQDRYKAIYEESGLPSILFQYPDATKATYDLETLLDISAQPGVFAMKNGVRNMRRWDVEIPIIRRERPDLQVLTCHDEYLLHTMFDVDGALVGYGNIAPELLIEMIKAGKAKDYAKARAIRLEYDLRQFSESVLERYSFHTMMYLKFTMYAQKHSLNEGSTFIRELTKDSFKARMAIAKKNFGEVIDLALSNANKPVLAGNAIAIHENNGPYLINENMYKKVFGRPYDSATVSQFIRQYQYTPPLSSF